MHYFFLEGQRLSVETEVELFERDFNHAYRVLRLKPGDVLAISDARGKAFRGTVSVSEPKSIKVRLVEELSSAESPLNIILCHALSKGEKMDLVVRQAVELGVKKIIPVTTKRSIPDLGNNKEKKKNQRWQNIARSAAAQCRRAFIPAVERVRDLKAILLEFKGNPFLVPWEEESQLPLVDVLKQPPPRGKAVLLFIGPEGGFENSEIEAINNAGGKLVHLGPRILRTETAATAAITMVQAAWGDLGLEGEK